MSSKLPLIILAGFFSILFIVPLSASAHNINIWTVPPGYWGAPGSPACTGNNCKTLLSCSGTGCKSLCDLAHTFQHFTYFGMSLAIFAFAPALFVWGGLMIMIAGASPERLSNGKKVLSGTLIGIAIVLFAFVIVNTVITALTGNSFGSFTCTSPF